jgi:hypothetical protein
MIRFSTRIAATVTIAAAMFATSALAQSADEVRFDFARAVYRNSASLVNHDRPQPLLRAVVVLRVKLDSQNHWRAEVFRDNPEQPEMTRRALESVTNLPPLAGLSPKAEAMLHDDGLIEAWLFQSDGRFALKTLAKPQLGA